MEVAAFEIEESISDLLPDLECTGALTCHLKELGVAKQEDLSYVTKEDVVLFISKIQARKLIAAWRRKGNCYVKTQLQPFVLKLRYFLMSIKGPLKFNKVEFVFV